jgi:hypothetical protein
MPIEHYNWVAQNQRKQKHSINSFHFWFSKTIVRMLDTQVMGKGDGFNKETENRLLNGHQHAGANMQLKAGIKGAI